MQNAECIMQNEQNDTRRSSNLGGCFCIRCSQLSTVNCQLSTVNFSRISLYTVLRMVI